MLFGLYTLNLEIEPKFFFKPLFFGVLVSKIILKLQQNDDFRVKLAIYGV